jgi:hypothetical protein
MFLAQAPIVMKQPVANKYPTVSEPKMMKEGQNLIPT